MLNLVCYVSLCEGLHAGAGSLSYIVHVDCCGLSAIVIKTIIIYYYYWSISSAAKVVFVYVTPRHIVTVCFYAHFKYSCSLTHSLTHSNTAETLPKLYLTVSVHLQKG